MMVKITLRLMSVLIVAFWLNFVFAEGGTKGPAMQFEEMEYDFGTVVQGSAVKHTFKFKNVGTDTLKIAQVKTSCGCTAAWESSKVIPPKAEGQIEVSFNTGSRQGKASKTVYVYSNDVN